MQAKPRTRAGRLYGSRTNRREAAVLEFAKQVQTVLWDYSTDGGAVGDFNFGARLPANSVVTNVYSDEQVAVAGATDVVLKAGATPLTATADFTVSSEVNSRALASSATAIKLSAGSELVMTIATTPATAGKIRWAVEFYISK